jgi:hypothetical protein
VGSLKYPLPTTKILLKATLPPAPPKIALEKNSIFGEIFDFFGYKMPFFQKILETSQDFHKSAVKFSKQILTTPPPPLKIFLNPYPPPKIFGQAREWLTLSNLKGKKEQQTSML